MASGAEAVPTCHTQHPQQYPPILTTHSTLEYVRATVARNTRVLLTMQL